MIPLPCSDFGDVGGHCDSDWQNCMFFLSVIFKWSPILSLSIDSFHCHGIYPFVFICLVCFLLFCCSLSFYSFSVLLYVLFWLFPPSLLLSFIVVSSVTELWTKRGNNTDTSVALEIIIRMDHSGRKKECFGRNILRYAIFLKFLQVRQRVFEIHRNVICS